MSILQSRYTVILWMHPKLQHQFVANVENHKPLTESQPDLTHGNYPIGPSIIGYAQRERKDLQPKIKIHFKNSFQWYLNHPLFQQLLYKLLINLHQVLQHKLTVLTLFFFTHSNLILPLVQCLYLQVSSIIP